MQRVNYAPLSNVSYLEVPCRAQDEEEDAGDNFDAKLHRSEHSVLPRFAKGQIRCFTVRSTAK